MKKLPLIFVVLIFMSCNNDGDSCFCRYAMFEYENDNLPLIAHNIPCNQYEVGEAYEKNKYVFFVACLDDNPNYCFCRAEGYYTDQTLNEEYGEGEWTENDRYFTTDINCKNTHINDSIAIGKKIGIFAGCILNYN